VSNVGKRILILTYKFRTANGIRRHDAFSFLGTLNFVRVLCLERYAGLQAGIPFQTEGTGMPDCRPAYLSKQRARTHTICYAAVSPH